MTSRHLSFWPWQSRLLSSRQPVCLLHHQLKVPWPLTWGCSTILSCLYSDDQKILHDLSHQQMRAEEIKQQVSWPWKAKKHHNYNTEASLDNFNSAVMLQQWIWIEMFRFMLHVGWLVGVDHMRGSSVRWMILNFTKSCQPLSQCHLGEIKQESRHATIKMKVNECFWDKHNDSASHCELCLSVFCVSI